MFFFYLFFFCVFLSSEMKCWSIKKRKKGTRLISSHLDQTSLVNKGITVKHKDKIRINNELFNFER